MSSNSNNNNNNNNNNWKITQLVLPNNNNNSNNKIVVEDYQLIIIVAQTAHKPKIQLPIVIINLLPLTNKIMLIVAIIIQIHLQNIITINQWAPYKTQKDLLLYI